MERIEVMKPVLRYLWMTVCAVDDATDDEILEACEKLNPAGTTMGWAAVVRTTDGSFMHGGEQGPREVCDHPGRTHLVVVC